LNTWLLLVGVGVGGNVAVAAVQVGSEPVLLYPLLRERLIRSRLELVELLEFHRLRQQ
jgi:hypothetical protein